MRQTIHIMHKLCKAKWTNAFLCTVFLFALTQFSQPSYAFGSHKHQHHYQEIPPEGNLWDELQDNFGLLEHADHPSVDKQIDWMIKHTSYLRNLGEHATPYLYFVYEEVRKRNMPAEIALLPMVESAYNPYAISFAGASGLWQIMPGTGTGFGLKQNWWYDGRRDLYTSTKAALDYLAYLHRFFDNDWMLAIAAYDSGEGTVQAAVQRNKRKHKPTDIWSLKLPRETRAYIPRLLAIAYMVKNADRYHVDLPVIPNSAHFAQIDVGRQIELKKVAKYAKISVKEVYRLNPGYNHWATDPKGPHTIVLPINTLAHFKEVLPAKKASVKTPWQRHIVKKGETLGGIALKYHTRINLLKSANNLKNDTIHINQALLIPKSKRKRPSDDKQFAARYKALHHKKVGPKRYDHVVKTGENYWILSHKYHVKPAAIRFWNHHARKHTLQPGETIIVWTKRHRSRRGKGGEDVIHYKVKKGDSLSLIAKRFHVTVKELNKWNAKISQQKYLQQKQKVLIRKS